MEYYQLPLQLNDLLKKNELKKCDLKLSIAQNIHLILTTHFGEYALDETYGCSVWENDFENIFSTNTWKEKISQSIKGTLSLHEQRLTNVQVKTEIGQEELTVNEQSHLHSIKRRLEIRVTGNYILTNEPFSFYERLFISPLSFD